MKERMPRQLRARAGAQLHVAASVRWLNSRSASSTGVGKAPIRPKRAAGEPVVAGRERSRRVAASGRASALLRQHVWRFFLAIGLAFAGLYLLLPRGGLAQGIVYTLLGIAMTSAIAVGI